MKALLDEQLSPQMARALRERGLDVEAVAERTDLPEAMDREVMGTAAGEERAVVTANVKDFRPIAAQRLADGRAHAGLILVPANRGLTPDAAGALADGIDAVMRAHPNGISGAEHWIPPSS